MDNINDFQRYGWAAKRLREDVGMEVDNYIIENDRGHRDNKETVKNMIMEGDEAFVFRFLERIHRYWEEELERVKNRSISDDEPRAKERRETMLQEKDRLKQRMQRFRKDIETVLETEGILFRLTNIDGQWTFEQIASERLDEADKELRSLDSEGWQDCLEGYNDAFNRYLDGHYDSGVTASLYASIEGVVKRICVDLEGWETRQDKNLKEYLDTMSQHDFFTPNPIMNEELDSLLTSMEKTFNKVGRDKPHRHNTPLGRPYCTLLVHQVAAYLYFLINRYDQYKEKKG